MPRTVAEMQRDARKWDVKSAFIIRKCAICQAINFSIACGLREDVSEAGKVHKDKMTKSEDAVL